MPSNIDYLRPQDILVMVKLLFWTKNASWTYAKLAKEVGLSQSEIYAGIKRAELASLYDPMTRRPNRAALAEFLLHGIRYSFPVRPGDRTKGVPTAHSAPPLLKLLVSNASDAYVWPSRNGKKSGLAVSPLYRTVPQAVQNDPLLHEILALIDALRVGGAREREVAAKELEKRVMAA